MTPEIRLSSLLIVGRNSTELCINCCCRCVQHLAGIRPTVKDRRPLIGTHYKYKQIHLLNGLGTRGVLLGPYLSDLLFSKIEFGIPLDQNVDINRYYKKMQLK